MKKSKYIFVILILGLLFFAVSCEEECKHKNMTDTVTPPSCTEAGKTTYLCPDCDFSYVDEVTAPKGHSFEKKVTSPTCGEMGYTTYVCACGLSYNGDYLSPLGHSLTETVTPPTCESAGYTTHSCVNCKYSYVSDHVAPTGHALIEAVTPPTCGEGGFTTYSCEDCEYSYVSDHTASAGHTLIENITLPTCEGAGYTTYSCKDCEYSYVSSYTAPTGHTHVEEIISIASCTEKGETKYTCACGDSYSIITPPDGHSFVRKVTMPTLSDMGFTEFDCENCEFSYIGDYVFYSDFFEGAEVENTDILAHGIDISRYQYETDLDGNYVSPDFEAIKASGVDYVIIRIADTSVGIDPTFETSYAAAKAAGLDVGAYLYTHADSVEDARLEAYFTLSAISGKQFEYPIYLDLEDPSLEEIPAETLTEICVEYFSILQRAGYYTGLYLNNNWLKNIVQTDVVLSKFDIWLARYPTLAEGETPVWDTDELGAQLGMWQYSDSGVVDGITANTVDLNFCYKDYPSLIKEYGFNGYDADFEFVDSGKSFATIIHDQNNKQINVRSKSDYFTTDGYDASLDLIGTASYGERYEIIEAGEKYLAILYNGQIAYITNNESYVLVTEI